MGQEYYFAINGQQRGPFPVDRLLAEGLIPDALVWTEGMAAWQTARTVPELSTLFANAPAGPTGPVTYAAPAYPPYAGAYSVPPDINSKKVLAGVLGIILGGWGIHRFVLGDVVGGILRIIITFATCGIGQILWLIEGVIYLTKSDEEFYRIYMVQKKSWF